MLILQHFLDFIYPFEIDGRVKASILLTSVEQLVDELELQLLVEGEVGIVASTTSCENVRLNLEPNEDVESLFEKMTALGHHRLDRLVRLKWIKNLKGRPLFELIRNGIRFYGANLGSIRRQRVYVLLGAEQKSGKTAADRDLLDRCEKELKRIKALIKELT